MPSEKTVPDDSGSPSEGDLGRLERLHLGAEELAALRKQGFVSRERRGGSVVFKLRFRVEKRQRVKYLGCNERQAIEIQSVLEKLQQVRNFDKQIREITRKANLLLRETKRRLEPLISEAGWKFHGRAIRRSYRKATNINKAICDEANHGSS